MQRYKEKKHKVIVAPWR